ncbi:MAG TPA: carbohydrate kinase [Pseudonocardiaceae bacterium]|nr:carbohydrate kinase [Pseudonocardiaceae bacterium]
MIVVGGEALVDLVPASPGPLAPLRPVPGGGPYNTAVALGRLGAPVAFLSRLSTDAFGDALLRRLYDAHVDVELVRRGPEPSTLAVVALDPNGAARYTFYVEGTADRLLADPGPLPDRVTTVSLGTLGLVLEPAASGYEKVLRRESARGRLTVLDPNIRPGLISDPAGYRARFASWLPDVGLLKSSEEDARWLADDESADIGDIGREWLDAGVGAVVITRGEAGLSVLRQRRPRVDVPAARAAVVDTIGAGDTVHAALIAWLHQHEVRGRADLGDLDELDWRAALGYAAKAAAITVSRPGAEPPYAAELAEPAE